MEMFKGSTFGHVISRYKHIYISLCVFLVCPHLSVPGESLSAYFRCLLSHLLMGLLWSSFRSGHDLFVTSYPSRLLYFLNNTLTAVTPHHFTLCQLESKMYVICTVGTVLQAGVMAHSCYPSLLGVEAGRSLQI